MTDKERIRILKDWVKELRSGEYKQTKRSLHDNYGFCCLGVLSDIAIDDDWIYKEGSALPSHWKLLGCGGSLPDKLRKNLKITEVEEWHLIRMNDDGTPFNEIAYWIEENLINEQV